MKKLMCKNVILMVTFIMGVIYATAATMPISEDFSVDEGELTLSTPKFSVSGGTLNLSSPIHATEYRANVEVEDAADKAIEMSVSLEASSFTENSDLGFMAFATASGSLSGGYLADIKANGTMRIILGTSPWTAIATGYFGTFDTNETYTLIFTARPAGANLDLFLKVNPSGGNATTISGTTSGTPAGKYFGLRTRDSSNYDTAASFDDFLVREVGDQLPIFEDFSVDEGDLTLSTNLFSVGSGTLNLATLVHAVEHTADVRVTAAAGKVIEMSFDLSASWFPGNTDIGFMAFATASGSASGGYLADFKPDGSMRIILGKSPWTGIATGGFGTFDTNETYTVTFTSAPAGTNLNLSLTVNPSGGAATTISGTTSGTSSGQYFGLRMRDPVTASFDDFSILIPQQGTIIIIQ